MRREAITWAAVFLAIMTLGAPKAHADGVLVFGGTGALGADIVKALLAKGEKVTVFARPSSDHKRLKDLDVAYATGDVLKVEDVLAAAHAGPYRVVVDASANRGSPGPFYEKAMMNIIAAAKAAGAKQVIIHSSIGVAESEAVFVGDKATFPVQDFDRMRPNMLDKAAAERHLMESGLGYTIIRNGLIDYEGTPATGKAKLTEDRMAFGRVTRPDLAKLTLDCLDQAACLNKIFHAVDDSLVGPRPQKGR